MKESADVGTAEEKLAAAEAAAADLEAELEAKIADVKTALEGTDLEAIKDATESLMSVRAWAAYPSR